MTIKHIILINYFNVINRLPAIIKWKIKQSKEVKQKIKTLTPDIKQGVENFIRKAKFGQDLRPHLSKRINQSDTTGQSHQNQRILR